MLGIFIPSVDATMISLKIVDTTEVPVLIVLVLTLLRDPVKLSKLLLLLLLAFAILGSISSYVELLTYSVS